MKRMTSQREVPKKLYFLGNNISRLLFLGMEITCFDKNEITVVNTYASSHAEPKCVLK